MSFVYTTIDAMQVGWIGDKAEDLQPHLYTDADFAGSTTNDGVHCATTTASHDEVYKDAAWTHGTRGLVAGTKWVAPGARPRLELE